MSALAFIVVLVLAILFWPSVPAAMQKVIGILVGVILLFWLLALLGVVGIPALHY